MGWKITLDEAVAAGAATVVVYCARDPIMAPGCRHSAELALVPLLARWGGVRLDDLPLTCSACGSRAVDARPNYPGQPEGGGWHNHGS